MVPREHIVDGLHLLKDLARMRDLIFSRIFAASIAASKKSRALKSIITCFRPPSYHRLRLKVLLNEDDVHVPTVTGVWRTANWHERETYRSVRRDF